MNKICLSMIVKNEAHCIRKCLESVKPFIDHWIICDTGSTDSTEKVVRDILGSIPGSFEKHEWIDFSTNRNKALELSREHGDYSLIIDADDSFVSDNPNIFKDLDKEIYSIEINQNGVIYKRNQLIKNSAEAEFKGAVHEYIDTKHDSTKLDGCTIMFGGTGSRTKDPEKYKKDCEILEKALIKDPNNARDTFYLAQSYKDSDQLDKAIEMYLKRVNMGGWQEEVYFSFLQLAILSEKIKIDPLAICNNYLRAYNYYPSRIESLAYLARYCRINHFYDHAYSFAKMGVKVSKPKDGLFIDADVYLWRIQDELATAAFSINKHKESLNISIMLANNPYVPKEEKQRILKNIEIIQKIKQ